MFSDHEAKLGEFFDGVARDGVMHDFFPEELPRLARCLLRWALAPGMKIVEPGCGSGRLTRFLSERVAPSGRILGFDLSPEMIRVASGRGLPGARFEVASVTAITAPDETFDRALVFNALPHFVDRGAAFAELRRVLKPGARLFIQHLDSRHAVNVFHRHVNPIVAEHQIPDNDTLRAELAEARFEVLGIGDTVDGYGVEAVRR